MKRRFPIFQDVMRTDPENAYLFKNLDNDYFTGFRREHQHPYKTLRENIVGGPSIIFHRYQERGLTKIKGEHLCE